METRMWKVHDHAKVIYIYMAGGCLASRDAQSGGRSRDEDGSSNVAGMWETAGNEQTTR